MRKSIGLLTVIFIVLGYTGILKASVIYPLEIFTNNGDYYNSSDLNLYVEVLGNAGTAEFGLYNESIIDSSIARIYFEDTCLLGGGTIFEGPGTSFSIPAVPFDLPGGQMLEPPFEKTYGFNAVADVPRVHMGINPNESIIVTFDLINGATLTDLISALNDGDFRIGVHLIGLPDGTSESAIIIPEPVTLFIVGFGLMVLMKRR